MKFKKNEFWTTDIFDLVNGDFAFFYAGDIKIFFEEDISIKV